MHMWEKNEVMNIIEERAANVGKAFITINSDCGWFPELKVPYGFITINLIPNRFVFTDGKSYFVSKSTFKECQYLVLLASPKPALHPMDFCIAFEDFQMIILVKIFPHS